MKQTRPDTPHLIHDDPAARTAQFKELYRTLRIRDQLRYYDDRRTEYHRARDQAVAVRNGLLAGAAVAALIGQVLAGTGRAGMSVVAAVLAALAGLVTAYETLIGFSQLAQLYGDAHDSLALAEIEWDETDPSGDLAARVDAIEEVISREIGQWGQLVATPSPEPLVVPSPPPPDPAGPPPARADAPRPDAPRPDPPDPPPHPPQG